MYVCMCNYSSFVLCITSMFPTFTPNFAEAASKHHMKRSSGPDLASGLSQNGAKVN